MRAFVLRELIGLQELLDPVIAVYLKRVNSGLTQDDRSILRHVKYQRLPTFQSQPLHDPFGNAQLPLRAQLDHLGAHASILAFFRLAGYRQWF